jgi:hypothetical protein
MLDTDAAWAAGFIDGDGSFDIRLADARFVGRMSITQKDQRPIKKIQELFGGSIHYLAFTSCYQYSASGTTLDYLLECIYPFLVLKAEQASLMIEFRSTQIGTQRSGKRTTDDMWARRSHMYSKMRLLNGRNP